MIIFVINYFGILAIKSERDAPISTHIYRPRSLSISAQLVQSQPRQIHISRRRRGVKSRQDQADSLFVVRLNAGSATLGKIAFKPAMPKALDHGQTVTRYVPGVKLLFPPAPPRNFGVVHFESPTPSGTHAKTPPGIETYEATRAPDKVCLSPCYRLRGVVAFPLSFGGKEAWPRLISVEQKKTW